jgi:hypothetical protein
MLNKKETQTWSVMCDKCHKILDREYIKEVVEMMEKQQAQKDNICSICKENLEGSQVLCWNCLCDIKDKVRKETQKDILEIVEKWMSKFSFCKRKREADEIKGLYMDTPIYKRDFEELTQKINSQEPKTSDTTGTTTPDTQKIKEIK